MALATGAAIALGGLAAAKITGDVISAGAQSDIAKAQQAGATRDQYSTA